jgi:hypothetical protein
VADGEDITNEIPTIEGGLSANHWTSEMCLIHADFKQFHGRKAKEFRGSRKVSSIMWAKVSSIMWANAGPMTSD